MDDANNQPAKKTAGVLKGGGKPTRFKKPRNKPVSRKVTITHETIQDDNR